MPRDIQHVIDAADDPEVTVLVPTGPITREVTSLHFAPVSLLKPLLVSVNRAKHRGPGLSDHEFPADIRWHLLSVVIHHRGVDPEERQRCTSRLRRDRP